MKNETNKTYNIVVITGPTAVGKTKFAIEVAKTYNGEIVSCDSIQLYRFMDLGSAKPTKDELTQVPHHLVDCVDPWVNFSVAQYQRLARDAITNILSRGKLPIISGGTGLYLNSILYDMDFSAPPSVDGYRKTLEQIAAGSFAPDSNCKNGNRCERNEAKQSKMILYEMLRKADPDAASRIHPNNTRKIIRALERLHQGEGSVREFKDVTKMYPGFRPLLICLDRDRNELYDRIDKRVDKLIDTGLVDEVRKLKKMGLTENNICMNGIGYKEILGFLYENYNIEKAIEKTKKNTRHYAKRQLTWFRRYDKMYWLEISEFESDEMALKHILTWIGKMLGINPVGTVKPED